MFVFKSTLGAEQVRRMTAESRADYWRQRYETQCTYADNERKGRLFHKEHAARLGESRDYWQNKATQAEAKLADLQKPKRDAGRKRSTTWPDDVQCKAGVSAHCAAPTTPR